MAPYVTGADFGILKVPTFEPELVNKLRGLGPIAFGIVLLLHLPFWRDSSSSAQNEPPHTERHPPPPEQKSGVDKPSPASDKQLRVQVSSAEEFINAIGSNRTIEFSAGSYDIGAVPDRYLKHVRWEDDFDGKTLTIRDVEGLTLRGPSKGSAEIIVHPRYPFVVTRRFL